MDQLKESADYILSRVSLRPKTAIVLGSGLGAFAKKLVGRVTLESRDVPNYPVPKVKGHLGTLTFGRVPSGSRKLGTPVLAFVGRTHYYETGDLDRVTFPIRLAYRLGVRNLILTNAAGGISPHFSPGDLMLITGQINLTFRRPQSLIEKTRRQSPTATEVYDGGLLKLALRRAMRAGVTLKQGIYCGVLGPSYETAAEIEMLRRIGADAVGMSTVHEAIAARQLGMRVMGISLITNLGTGLVSEPATHEEVIAVARGARKKFEALLTAVLTHIGS
jgi:purine-nucleoside phosphorylase